MRIISLISIPFFAVAACAPVAPQVVSQIVAPTLDGGSYSTGGGLTVAAEAQNQGGMTALCGVWAESERQSVLSRGKASQVMGTGSAYLDGEVLQRGLLFMRKVESAPDYAGMQANCVITSRPWQGGDEARPLQIRIPRQVVHRENDDIDGGGPIVLFTQTGPKA